MFLTFENKYLTSVQHMPYSLYIGIHPTYLEGVKMKKPYWTVKGNFQKFYKFDEAKAVAEDIAKMGFGEPAITYHRMLGALWVTTTSEATK